MNLFQSAADLLCFVLKYKMVTVAMLNFIFVRFLRAKAATAFSAS